MKLRYYERSAVISVSWIIPRAKLSGTIVMRPKFQKRSALKPVSRTIPLLAEGACPWFYGQWTNKSRKLCSKTKFWRISRRVSSLDSSTYQFRSATSEAWISL